MIRSRFYCQRCRLRSESEIVYDKKSGLWVYFYLLVKGVLRNAETHTPLCPNCGAELQKHKIVKDVPDRYIDTDGALKDREYKEL